MKTKRLAAVSILGLCVILSCCKTVKIDNLLNAPDTWRSEVLEFPLIFARSLPYTGEEHIRFADGWEDLNHEGYFSYVFIWVLNTDPGLTVSKIESDMDTYFTGLMKMGLLSKFNFFKRLPKTKTMFREAESKESFKGQIEVYDAFFKKNKILLNAKVSSSYCNNLEKYIVYFELSPKEFDAPIWYDLDKVMVKHNCD